MEDKIVKIINEMAEYLNVAQMKKLQEVLLQTFSESEAQKEQISNEEYLKLFLDAKKIEGCSERTIQYYRVTVERLLQTVPVWQLVNRGDEASARLCHDTLAKEMYNA